VVIEFPSDWLLLLERENAAVSQVVFPGADDPPAFVLNPRTDLAAQKCWPILVAHSEFENVSSQSTIVQRPKSPSDNSRGDYMTHASKEYVLGQSSDAARRLNIQDLQFADESERLLDEVGLRPNDRVVEIGSGAGGFSRRILRRLGAGGVLVGVDYSPGLLEQARQNLIGVGEARFEPVSADVTHPGPWLDGADVVLGRTVVHHIPMAETWLGRLRTALRPGTRVGFVEPEFRALLGRFPVLEASGRPELAVLRVWAEGISRFYQACGLSPAVGATLAWALKAAGYSNVKGHSCEHGTDQTVIDNLLLYYDEIRDRYQSLGIMTADEIEQQKRQLRALPAGELPAVWGIHCATAIA
jgi:ubiquinone/menaquinone biosynthesis C-methylase UbiE